MNRKHTAGIDRRCYRSAFAMADPLRDTVKMGVRNSKLTQKFQKQLQIGRVDIRARLEWSP